ncbi:uncharacterized protein AMSG_07644 [Thecamonas trahens ATCC 50062]|uniref:HYDIN/VesB/CFA65-like Ig-like domain-containing protein n=1 Tax=Thecamonas trahens ATCC 50062 TaxID=461836 RepID=A0A0L0DGI9_THETB|nr:hypothetical protein AMSG_07644 [Thecamonas trahens ATCC 50062]KNC51449.1 hypothetical protein AMSG_07644 [Thecamonas trahens ATCC 50062]|eukprot:XP_013756111.1 hypothetical protein AMSG_07644 [Thecamonas trahens ATCC 50062]
MAVQELAPAVKELQLVEPAPRPRVPYPLLDHQVYQQTGGNEAFVVRPATVHFGGFTPNNSHSLVVAVVNTSSVPQRLHIVPPQSAYFSLTYVKKAPFIAPGMALKLRVSFQPTELRYYYDCIRLHCPGANLLVPIHGYPVVAKVEFPKVVDFGIVELGNHASRSFQLATDVPIEFDYAITPAGGVPLSPCFDVSPASGVIPAEGSVTVTITYTPLEYVTASAQLELNVSQFNFEPRRCSLAGSSQPGLLRDALVRRMNAAAEERTAVLAEDLKRVTYGGAAVVVTQAVDSYDTNVKIVHSGGGAGHGDPYTRKLQRKASMRRRTLRAAGVDPRSHEPAGSGSEPGRARGPIAVHTSDAEELERLSSHGNVVAILAQRGRGRSRSKTLRTAIAEKHEAQARASQFKSSLDELFADPFESRQVKEYAFSEVLTEQAAIRRANELKLSVARGANLPSDAELARIVELRDAHDEQVADVETERALAARIPWSSSERPTLTQAGLPFAVRNPKFDALMSVEWERRVRALTRLRDVVRTLIVRARANKRLAKIRAFLTVVGFDKDKIAAIVQDEKRQQEAALVAHQQKAETLPLTARASQVLVDPHKLQAHVYVEVNHYRPYPLPQHSVWVPFEEERELRTGAEEEDISRSVPADAVVRSADAGRVWRESDTVAPALPEPLPAVLRAPPLLPELHIFNPAPQLPSCVPLVPYSEVDDAHLFRPRALDAGGLAASRNRIEASLAHAKAFSKPSQHLVPRTGAPFAVPSPPPPLVSATDLGERSGPGSHSCGESRGEAGMFSAADLDREAAAAVSDVDVGLPIPSKALLKVEFPPVAAAAASAVRLSVVERQLEVEAQTVRRNRLDGMQGRLARLSSLFVSHDVKRLLSASAGASSAQSE